MVRGLSTAPPVGSGPVRPVAPAAGAVLAIAAAALVLVAGMRWVRHARLGPTASVPALAADAPATLLVVLHPSDCESYGPMLARWDRLHRDGGVRVVGAVLDAPGPEAARDSLRRRVGVSFPLRFDVAGEAEALALRLGYDETPVSVLLDGGGRPRAVVPATADPTRVRAAAALVAESASFLGRRPEPAGPGPGSGR